MRNRSHPRNQLLTCSSARRISCVRCVTQMPGSICQRARSARIVNLLQVSQTGQRDVRLSESTIRIGDPMGSNFKSLVRVIELKNKLVFCAKSGRANKVETLASPVPASSAMQAQILQTR